MKLKLCLAFYRSFCFTALLFTVVCGWFYYQFGMETFTTLFWFKAITSTLIFLYIRSYKRNQFYFYKNLGVGKRMLWTVSLGLDTIIWIAVAIIALNLYGTHS